MRHINCAFEFDNFICEIQIMFSELQPSINNHVNHKLYELKRAESLKDFATAIREIGKNYNDEDIVPVTPEYYIENEKREVCIKIWEGGLKYFY